MKCWALCLAALGLVYGSVGFVEAHIMTPDFVRQANSESIATHEKELEQENKLRQEEKLWQEMKTKKKEMEHNERLEKKAMENMSEEKVKEMKREKRDADKRAEMKEMLELKRLEKKFMLKSEFGQNTELKSVKKHEKKSLHLKKQLKKNKFQKELSRKELKESKSRKPSKEKHFQRSASVKEAKRKHLKHLAGKGLKKRSMDETVLKHAPEYMKLGRNLQEKRALKKLRMRMKREAELLPYATHTKAFLPKYSEEDQDYWSDEEGYIKKDADESLQPDSDYNEVESSDYPVVEGEQEEPTPSTSSPVIEEEEEVEAAEEISSSDFVHPMILDVAENQIIPVTEQDMPEYVPTSSDASVVVASTQLPVVITSSAPSPTPDVAENEIIPVTEAVQPEVVEASSVAPVEEELATQPPVVVPTTGLPVSEVPSTGLPTVAVSTSEEVVVPEISTTAPLLVTSQAPAVSTVELIEAVSAGTDSIAPAVEPVEPVEPSAVSYEVPDNQGEPDLTIVTLAPELPPASSAPLLATFAPSTTSAPEAVATTASPTEAPETTVQAIPETTTTPVPTSTQPSGPWPWENLGPNEENQCGQARFDPGTRVDRGQRRTLKILNGKEALPGSFPWQVALLDKDRDMLCGGSLIAPRWVMTAAHCVRKKLFVRLSEHHIHDKDGYEIEQKVRRVYRHPDYNSSTIDNDIALLRLPALPPFPDSSSGGVSRVGVTDRACLPADGEDMPPVGTRCLVMGWGKASTSHSYGTDVLMYTRLPIISRKACIRANRKTITENMFCAGHYKGGSDTCSGDSGGPLLCSSGGTPSEETWTIYGVTSFGDGCGNAGKMGVYAKVNNYLGWIAGIMRKY